MMYRNNRKPPLIKHKYYRINKKFPSAKKKNNQRVVHSIEKEQRQKRQTLPHIGHHITYILHDCTTDK